MRTTTSPLFSINIPAFYATPRVLPDPPVDEFDAVQAEIRNSFPQLSSPPLSALDLLRNFLNARLCRHDLQTPVAGRRALELSREDALNDTFDIIDRLPVGESEWNADLSAYVKACFGLYSESTHESFHVFQPIALELSKNTQRIGFLKKLVTRSSVNLAAKLYIAVEGADHAFTNGRLDRAGFLRFVARHVGMSMDTVADAIAPDYIDAISLSTPQSNDPTSEPEPEARQVKMNHIQFSVPGARPSLPALPAEMWCAVASFLPPVDLRALAPLDVTTRRIFAGHAGADRLLARAKKATDLADVQWFLGQHIPVDQGQRDFIRDADSAFQSELLYVLAAGLGDFKAPDDFKNAFDLILEATWTLPLELRHRPLTELAGFLLRSEPNSDHLLGIARRMANVFSTGPTTAAAGESALDARQMFDALLKAPESLAMIIRLQLLLGFDQSFLPKDWMPTDVDPSRLKRMIDAIESLPVETRSVPLATLYLGLWQQEILLDQHQSGTSLHSLSPFMDRLKEAADSIPAEHRVISQDAAGSVTPLP